MGTELIVLKDEEKSRILARLDALEKRVVTMPRVWWLLGRLVGRKIAWARRVVERTRDHSHIEVLLREGLITEDEYRTHPLRNYVEYCLGGEPADPTLALSDTHLLKADDLVLLCSDGVWSGIEDRDIAHFLCQPDAYRAPEDALETLLHRAVAVCEPVADNTTAALVHWQGTNPQDAGTSSS